MKRILFLLALFSQIAFGQIQLQRNSVGVPVKISPAGTSFIRLTIGNQGNININGVIHYHVPANANKSSAGLFDSNDKLIRTLWSGRTETPNSNVTVQYDGFLDDFSTKAGAGNYTVKVLTNAVTHTTLGGIGNTGVFTGNVWKGFAGVNSLVFASGNGFWGEPFSEGGSSVHNFSLNDLSQCYNQGIGVQAHVGDMCTDGTNIYVCAKDDYGDGGQGPHQQFVYAFKASDLSPVQFSSGEAHRTGQAQNNYNYFLARTTGDLDYTGIAVNSNFIFVACPATNNIRILNKTTGALVTTVSLQGVVKVCATTDNSFLWVYQGSSLKKYALNNDGTLRSAAITIPYTGNLSFNISPVTNELAVLDDVNQQIKFYNGSTGTLNSTQGQADGYVNSPAVTYNKFMFDAIADGVAYHGSIAFQPDGSYWVADVGNFRTLHFSANKTYIEQFAFIPAFRLTTTDYNDPSRVFANGLEFFRDYTKPLTDPSSWHLQNNWGVNFENVQTLSNGGTYGVTNSNGNATIYELTAAGPVSKYTRSEPYGLVLEPDGSLTSRLNFNNEHIDLFKEPLTGFDNNRVPQWGAKQTVASVPVQPNTPLYYLNNARGSSTNPTRQFLFNPTFDYNNFNSNSLGGQFHFGSILTGGNTFNWLVSNSTYKDYEGDYPRDGYYDIGNGNATQHNENCLVNVSGSNAIWHVNGEFWGAGTGKPGGEINISNHYHESGLLIGNFGATSEEVARGKKSQAEFAGNSFSTSLVPANGKLYYNTADENTHGAISQWEIGKLESISLQTVPLKILSPITISADPTDLMAGLPSRSNFTGGNGWALNGAITAKTNVVHWQKDSLDIAITSNANASQYATRSLNNTVSLTSWKLSGGFTFYGSAQTLPENNYNYFELLDSSGKVLIRFWLYADSRNNYYSRLYLNGQQIAEGQPADFDSLYALNDFFCLYNSGNLAFKIGRYLKTVNTPFESGGNLSAPAYIRINQYGTQTHQIGLYKLKFVPGDVQSGLPN